YLNERDCKKKNYEEWGRFTGRTLSGEFSSKVAGAIAIALMPEISFIGAVATTLNSVGISLFLNKITKTNFEEKFGKAFVSFYNFYYNNEGNANDTNL